MPAAAALDKPKMDLEAGIPADEKDRRSDRASRLSTPADQILLRWNDVKFEVDVVDTEAAANTSWYESKPTKKKTILHGVSGQARPGEVIAVMGPSGCGKTSLLNILSRRTRSGVTGSIEVNDQPAPLTLKQLSGYVLQSEDHFSSLTVKEILLYSAELKLPQNMPYADKEKVVDKVLEEMDLTHAANTRVGEIGSGISGGERRRLAIAGQILNEPPLLMLDEPTSGLDAASASMVVQRLRAMAGTGRTILCTIHQPRMSVLNMFDKVLLLGKGRTVFFGTVSDCLTFFASNGYKCPGYENPADYMLDLINTQLDDESVGMMTDTMSPGEKKTVHKTSSDLNEEDTQTPTEDREQIINKLSLRYTQSDYAKSVMQKPAIIPTPLKDISENSTSFFHQFSVVFRRSFFHKLREPIAAVTQLFNCTLVPFLIATIFWQLPTDQNGAANRLSVVSLIVLLQAFVNFDILVLFPLERSVYLREQSSGLYRTSAFYLGRTMAEVPLLAFFTFILCTIAYWGVGLQADATKFVNFVIIVEAVTFAGSSLMLFAGAFAQSMDQSNILATLFIILFMLFDGNWIALSNIPGVYRWIHDVSFMAHGVKAAVANEMRGLTFSCDDSEKLGGVCPLQTGDQYLRQIDFEDVNIGLEVLYMVIFMIVTRLFAYFGLRFLYTGKTFRERLND